MYLDYFYHIIVSKRTLLKLIGIAKVAEVDVLVAARCAQTQRPLTSPASDVTTCMSIHYIYNNYTHYLRRKMFFDIIGTIVCREIGGKQRKLLVKRMLSLLSHKKIKKTFSSAMN